MNKSRRTLLKGLLALPTIPWLALFSRPVSAVQGQGTLKPPVVENGVPYVRHLEEGNISGTVTGRFLPDIKSVRREYFESIPEESTLTE